MGAGRARDTDVTTAALGDAHALAMAKSVLARTNGSDSNFYFGLDRRISLLGNR